MLASPSRKKEMGILRGLKPSDPAVASINIFDPSLSPEDLWGVEDCPSGGALLDAVLTWYSHGTHNVPWFTYADGNGSLSATNAQGHASGVQKARSIVKSPLSRELQESTVESYKHRIFAESISQVAAGVIDL